MNGIKISKEDWLRMEPESRDAALYDCLQGINKHLKRVYIVGGVMAVILLLEFPNWTKFLISKAIAAF